MDEFLAKYIVKKDSDSKPITHTAMDGGKWHIPEKKLQKFYKPNNLFKPFISLKITHCRYYKVKN